jgi:hypothetical protein
MNNGLTHSTTYRGHAYQLLHAMLATAVIDGRIPANPAQIPWCGKR